MPLPFLIEFPADDAERAQRFWGGLLGTRMAERGEGEGQGWQGEYGGVHFGVHERGPGPGDKYSLPYFTVPDLVVAVERVRELGGEVVHDGEKWTICRDSEGTPFGLTQAS